MAISSAGPVHGPTRPLGGLSFSLGLILVIVGGAERFSGNALTVIAAVDRVIAPAELARSWAVVYVGNLAAALALSVLVWLTELTGGPFGAMAVAEAKAALGPVEVLARGVICNMFGCLAVWLMIAAHDVAGKILAILSQISAFVLLGMEPPVADMVFGPLDALAGAPVTVADVGLYIVLVKLEKIVGGAGGVALAYRLAHGSPTRRGRFDDRVARRYVHDVFFIARRRCVP